MTDLDNKLEEILLPDQMKIEREWGVGDEREALKYTYDLIASIKQVFIDAGWRNLSSKGGLISATVIDDRGKIEYMTGREWYDKFEKEMRGKTLPYCASHDGDKYVRTAVDEAMKAAKKAAGLE